MLKTAPVVNERLKYVVLVYVARKTINSARPWNKEINQSFPKIFRFSMPIRFQALVQNACT